jgi:DNA-binding NarL/FixJ family response regulator
VAAQRRPCRVFVVDDHPAIREGFRSMLSGEEIQIVGEAGSGAEAIERAAAVDLDVILLDMKLPDLDGLEVLRRLKELVPAAAVLVISMHDDPLLVRRAIEAGAAGYALKGIDRQQLITAVHAVCDGEAVLDPTLLRAIVSEAPRSAPSRMSAFLEGPEPLTRLELDVLRLMADGLTNAQISERMRWSLATTKKYVQAVLEKLRASDRTQAAVTAVRLGLLG